MFEKGVKSLIVGKLHLNFYKNLDKEGTDPSTPEKGKPKK